MGQFRHLDLFSGIGGFALAASWVWGEQHVYPMQDDGQFIPPSMCPPVFDDQLQTQNVSGMKFF